MKRFKKSIALFLALATMFALMVSASAMVWGNPIKTGSKSTSFGTIIGEIYTYNGYYNGHPTYEPSAVTKVTGSYTMAEVTAAIDLKYNDTGALLASGRDRQTNQNYAQADTGCDALRNAPVVAFTSHGATYTKSDVLYMSTFL